MHISTRQHKNTRPNKAIQDTTNTKQHNEKPKLDKTIQDKTIQDNGKSRQYKKHD